MDAVSKECTMLHQDTRNPRSEAFSLVCAQENSLIWQNWSTVLFLLPQTALCLVWAGAQKGCGSAWRAAQQPGEEPRFILRDHSKLKPPSHSQCSQELHGCTRAHTTPLSWVPSAKGRRPFPITQCISNTIEWSKVHRC